jgi:L-threonylcarbamoyladenylate synthase
VTWSVNPKINQAALIVASGGVLAYPTEAVWGLGCDPFNQDAVERLLSLKNRSPSKGLILLAGTVQQLEFLIKDLTVSQRETLLNSWPGPNTWLIPHCNRVPDFIHGDFATVAVRVSPHPVVQALCLAVGGPIVSTSANPQGLAPALTQLRARCYFGNGVHYCPGVVGKSAKPSKIQDLLTGQIIRAG